MCPNLLPLIARSPHPKSGVRLVAKLRGGISTVAPNLTFENR